MNFADAKEVAATVRARRATHDVVKIVSPVSTEYRETPKSAEPKLVLGGFCRADFLDGATVYVQGAPNPIMVGAREFVAHPGQITERKTGVRPAAPTKVAA